MSEGHGSNVAIGRSGRGKSDVVESGNEKRKIRECRACRKEAEAGNNSGKDSSQQQQINNHQIKNKNKICDNVEQNKEPQSPPSTLVQTVGNRPFKVVQMMVQQQLMLILSFRSGITLLMPTTDANRPTEGGVAQLDVHRKFLPSFNKYLHWISFTFQGTGGNVLAQIMLPTRLAAACQLVKGGASACFLQSPVRIQRRPQVPTRRRRIINGRR